MAASSRDFLFLKTNNEGELKMEGKKAAMEIFEIVKRNKMLPTKMEDLEKIVFVGPSAMKFYRTKLTLMENVGATEEQIAATLKDGQQIGELILDAEVQLGELYQQVPKGPVGQPKKNSPKGPGELTKPQKIGKPSQAISETERISKNPDIVAAVKAEAKARNDIPTKTAVLEKIKHRKTMATLEKVKEVQRKEKILKKAKPPSMDKYSKEVEKAMDDVWSKLAPMKGKTQYFESSLNRETFKNSLDRLSNMVEHIKKEMENDKTNTLLR